MPRSRDYPDHARLLTLLWRTGDEPSSRSGLTVGRIVSAGTDLANEEGLDAVTMRRVAERLGVGAMSLYTYVPGKEELIALMVDRAFGELADGPVPGASWRDRLAAIAHQRWELYSAQPWLVDVATTRPAVGPNVADRYEVELAAIDDIGLVELEMDLALELVDRHVAGAARKAFEIAVDAERSGMSDDEWWYSVLPVLSRVMADRSYPVSSRVGEAVGAPHTDPARDLEFGLARILDGLELLVAGRSGAADD